MNGQVASSPLTDLANRHGTDKGTVHLNAHGYTRVYEQLFGAARTASLTLLEIGLLHPEDLQGDGKLVRCPSLAMWREYLPNATLIGLDIREFGDVGLAGTTIIRGDQGDREDLRRVIAAAPGGFDVIIDDGSHASHHQQISLGYLFPFLRAGGAYVIEDLHWQSKSMERPGITVTRTLLKNLASSDKMSSAMQASEVSYLRSHVREILFFDSLERSDVFTTADALCVIWKRSTDSPSQCALAAPPESRSRAQPRTRMAPWARFDRATWRWIQRLSRQR